MSELGVIEVASAAVTTLFVILLFVKVFVELIVGIATLPIVAQVVKSGDVLLTSPPVPVEVAHPRVSTIAQTVVSSRTVAAAVVIVVLSGTVRDFIPDREVTSESIKAPALVTFVVSVTSAPSSTFIIVRTSLAESSSTTPPAPELLPRRTLSQTTFCILA